MCVFALGWLGVTHPLNPILSCPTSLALVCSLCVHRRHPCDPGIELVRRTPLPPLLPQFFRLSAPISVLLAPHNAFQHQNLAPTSPAPCVVGALNSPRAVTCKATQLRSGLHEARAGHMGRPKSCRHSTAEQQSPQSSFLSAAGLAGSLAGSALPLPPPFAALLAAPGSAVLPPPAALPAAPSSAAASRFCRSACCATRAAVAFRAAAR